MPRPRATEMTDEELRAAIAEARQRAAGSPLGLARPGEYSAEAGRRLVERGPPGSAARIAYLKAVGRRGFAVFWWGYLAAVVLAAAATLHDMVNRVGDAGLGIVVTLTVAGTLPIVRWVLTSRWAFGPRL